MFIKIGKSWYIEIGGGGIMPHTTNVLVSHN